MVKLLMTKHMHGKRSVMNRNSFFIWLAVVAIAFLSGGLDFAIAGGNMDAEDLSAWLDLVSPEAMRLAIEDIEATFPDQYKSADNYLAEIARLTDRLPDIKKAVANGEPEGIKKAQAIAAFQRKVLLSNPLLDFDGLLLVKRRPIKDGKAVSADKFQNEVLGFPRSSKGNTLIPKNAIDNEIAILSPVSPEGKLTTIYRPEGDRFVGNVDLHFDAGKLLFSMRDDNKRFNIFETTIEGGGLKKLTYNLPDDVDSYDACYLPDGGVVFGSTACFQGVPCNNTDVALLYRMDANGENIRQLCFEQDHDFNPTIMENGRIMYLRWEYADTPHYFTRIMFHMNPDGTGQMEYYGSNSFWPNSVFGAKPIPGHPSKFIGIVNGHHEAFRAGELVLFDVSKGRFEADGVIQRIPGRGKEVEPVIKDKLCTDSWPKFMHPYPLSEKYFLVSCKLTEESPWDIYLADVYDNLVPIYHIDSYGLFEPVPVRKTPTPPVIPDRVDLSRKDALVYLVDIYSGPGLKDIPRGKVKKLRLFAFHFGYVGTAGHNKVGIESGWDVKRILGTVPVEEDGSAFFRVPANTPISVQPLDENGSALQFMRSWFVGMPGETLSCVGCHDRQNMTPPSTSTLAARKTPSEIKPWYGDARPFTFKFEVQPVLDKYCVGCHNGKPSKSGKQKPDFRDIGRNSYLALHPFVRRMGPETDNHMFRPMEYHASTSELIQKLAGGHNNVELDDESWEKLYAWIDLNAPEKGFWTPDKWKKGCDQSERRLTLQKRYANLDTDPEGEYFKLAAEYALRTVPEPIKPKRAKKIPREVPEVSNWPFNSDQAKLLQSNSGGEVSKSFDLGNGLVLKMVLIPEGEFVMTKKDGSSKKVKIDKPFWMSVCEVTNAEYGFFDQSHDSRYIDQQWKDHTTPGYPANLPDQPVIRISWNEAVEFCKWLSEKPGMKFGLPSESQWQWACRAGSGDEFWYGGLGADFGKFANLADSNMTKFAVKGVNPKPVKDPPPSMAFIPRVDSVDDGQMTVCSVGSYQPNPWGLYDMHGNVAEWTFTDEGANGPACGGSWRDRPKRATASSRQFYEPYQKVFNVGFRVICDTTP